MSDKFSVADLKNKPVYHFIGVILIVFIIQIFLSGKTGIGADERFYVPHAKTFFKFYSSMGKDTSYTQIFKGSLNEIYAKAVILPEVLTFTLAKLTGNSDETTAGFYFIRHLSLAIFGLIGMIFTGLIAQKLTKNWYYGIVAVLLLFLSPHFFGHTLVNGRDIPYAAFYAMGIYYLVCFLEAYPNYNLKTLLYFALSIVFALGTRGTAGAAVLVAMYIGTLGIIFLRSNFFGKTYAFDFSKLLKHSLIIGAISFVGIFPFWPYGLDHMGSGISEALSSASSFPVNIRQLFEGKMMMSNEFPSYYLVKFAYVTTPIIILLLLVVSVVLFIKNRKTADNAWLVFLVICTAVIPVAIIIYQKSNVYTGWRHILFTYLPLMAFVSWGISQLMETLSKPMYKYIAIGLISLGFVSPLMWTVNNTGHLYCYFNEIVGGNKGAFGNYEQDYWALGVTEGGRWLKENVLDKENGKDTLIISSNMQFCLEPYLKEDLAKGKIKYRATKFYQKYFQDKNNDQEAINWDYGIYYAAFLEGDQLRNNNFWPPKGTVHIIEANGAPIGIVIKRDPAKNDLIAIDSLIHNHFQGALPYFQKAVVYNPYDDEIWNAYGKAYEGNRQYDKAIECYQRAVEIAPSGMNGFFNLSIAQATSGKIQDAENTLNTLITNKPDAAIQAYNLLANIFKSTGDMNKANYYGNMYNTAVQEMQEKQEPSK
ncbi:MAG: tetratricopeptide repeat protein [Bacteroidota bacterium]